MKKRDRIGGDRHKLKHIKSHLYTEKHFFCCQDSQTLAQVAQRGHAVSVLRDGANLMGHSPGQPALTNPSLSRGLA